MLVLGRYIGESLVIGKPGDVLTEPIVITCVADYRGVGRRLGIECQRDLEVMRKEFLEQQAASERRERVQSGKGGE